jgi:hypothetical protein
MQIELDYPVQRKSSNEVSDYFVVGTAVVVGIVFLGYIFYYCHFGFDFTDEAFSLNWISNPSIYKVSLSQFGYLYHPIYCILGADVALLRQINILLTSGLAWLFCNTLLKSFASHHENKNPISSLYIYGIGFVLSTSSLVLLELLPPTPNYNYLALQSLLIESTGLLLVGSENSRSSLTGWTLLGVGGWLAMMAKPSTAAALCAAVLVYLVFSKKLKIPLLALSLVIAVGLICVSAWIIDGSIHVFVLRYLHGAEDVARLGAGHSISGILRWDSFVLNKKEKAAFISTSIVVFLAIYSSLLNFKSRQTVSVLLILTYAIVLTIISALYCSDYFVPEWGAIRCKRMLLGAVPLGVVLALVTVCRRNIVSNFQMKTLALAAFFAVLPHVYAFGSGNNYWKQSSLVAFFWIIACLIIVDMIRGSIASWRTITSIAISAQIITIILVLGGMDKPYRQSQPLRSNTDTVKVAFTVGELKVSHESAVYIRNFQVFALQNGFQKDTPVIDLTGHSPGMLYMLAAKSIGLPWMIGGYYGSELFATAGLDRVSCDELGRAWILEELGGPSFLNPTMLHRYGIDINVDYKEAGEMNLPVGLNSAGHLQRLLKPTRCLEIAKTACVNQRLGK